MLGMGSIARNEVTEDSKRIIDICRDLVKRSGITNAEFYKKSGTARAYAARERESQITNDLIDRIAAHPEDYDMAANKDPNARLEAETPDD